MSFQDFLRTIQVSLHAYPSLTISCDPGKPDTSLRHACTVSQYRIIVNYHSYIFAMTGCEKGGKHWYTGYVIGTIAAFKYSIIIAVNLLEHEQILLT